MRSLDKYISNPVIPFNSSSLEKEEFKEGNKVNTLFKLNLKKIIKNKYNPNRLDIYCIGGKMYFKK